jgi:hypothetical protein
LAPKLVFPDDPDPKTLVEPPDAWFPELAKTLPPELLLATELNPPWLLKLANPPDDGGCGWAGGCAPEPNVDAFLFAKDENPDWPKAGVEPDPAPAPHGEDLVPN